jgi:hypothetical protein
MRTRFLSVTCALTVLAAVPSLALAQNFLNQIGGGGGGKSQPPPKDALPPGLPGAASSKDAPPPSHGPIDMEPNDALFDAINRGDIAAARDAISRGADLRGQNVLGMTPLELSVDLGRNDISFMLLSMRGGDDSRPPKAQATTTATKANAAKQARQVPTRSPVRVAAPVHAPPQTTARLFAGDGGTPNPSAGFLGFGSGQR